MKISYPFNQIKGPNAEHYHNHFRARFNHIPSFNRHWNEGLALIREAGKEPTFERMQKYFLVIHKEVYPDLDKSRSVLFDAPLYILTISSGKEITQKEICSAGRILILVPWLASVIGRTNFDSLTVRIGKKKYDVKPYK